MSAIAGYRDWVMSRSRMGSIGLVLAGLVVLVAVGLAVETLQATIGVVATQVVTAVVLLAVLYTWYALGRSVLG